MSIYFYNTPGTIIDELIQLLWTTHPSVLVSRTSAYHNTVISFHTTSFGSNLTKSSRRSSGCLRVRLLVLTTSSGT